MSRPITSDSTEPLPQAYMKPRCWRSRLGDLQARPKPESLKTKAKTKANRFCPPAVLEVEHSPRETSLNQVTTSQ